MRVRQIFIVLFLVLLPTAILSFMAHRALENRERILRDRYRAAAASAMESVSKRLRSRLYGNMDQVRATFHEYLQRTARFRDIESTALRLRQTIPLVEEVFIFMEATGEIFVDFCDIKLKRDGFIQ